MLLGQSGGEGSEASSMPHGVASHAMAKCKQCELFERPQASTYGHAQPLLASTYPIYLNDLISVSQCGLEVARPVCGLNLPKPVIHSYKILSTIWHLQQSYFGYWTANGKEDSYRNLAESSNPCSGGNKLPSVRGVLKLNLYFNGVIILRKPIALL